MVRHCREHYVIVAANTQLLRKTFRSIFFSVVNEFFGTGAQVSVQYPVQTVDPRRGKPFGRIPDHRIRIGFKSNAQFFVRVPRRTVLQSRIDRLGHDSVTVDDVYDVIQRPPLGEIGFTVQAGVFDRFFEVSMADDPHFGKVVNAFPATKQLALRHRRARKAPAGAGLRLILHRRHGHQHFIGKYIGSGILSVLLGLFRRIFRTGDTDQQCAQHPTQQIFFHAFDTKFNFALQI